MSTDVTETENALDAKRVLLLAELRGAAERKYRLNRWVGPLICGAFVFQAMVGCIKLLHVSLSPTVHHHLLTVTLWLLYAVGLSGLAELLLLRRVDRSKKRLKTLLMDLSEDVRAVGVIAQLCLPTRFFSVGKSAVGPLLNLLPRVTRADARYISDSQMEALLALLVGHNQPVYPSSTALQLAILKALEQIGDSRAIEPVRRLTKGIMNVPCHQAARECLAILEQQGKERKQDRFLLLPASPEVGRETLLRPTVSQVETPPALLLRASHDEQ